LVVLGVFWVGVVSGEGWGGGGIKKQIEKVWGRVGGGGGGDGEG